MSVTWATVSPCVYFTPFIPWIKQLPVTLKRSQSNMFSVIEEKVGKREEEGNLLNLWDAKILQSKMKKMLIEIQQ